jgi:hypothetical protein
MDFGQTSPQMVRADLVFGLEAPRPGRSSYELILIGGQMTTLSWAATQAERISVA